MSIRSMLRIIRIDEDINPEDINPLETQYYLPDPQDLPYAQMIDGILIVCGPIEYSNEHWDKLMLQHPDESYCLVCKKWINLQTQDCH